MIKFIALALVLLLPVAAQAGEPDEAYAKAIGSTVYIRAFGPGREEWSGTGVIMHEEGMIVTVRHVVAGRTVAAFTPIYDTRGKVITDAAHYRTVTDAELCMIVATDVKRDLAVIRFKTLRRGLRRMSFAVMTPVPGQAVYTIGNPAAAKWSLAVGNVQQVNNAILRSKLLPRPIESRVLEIAPAITHGFSGGPVFNTSGDLLGIASASSNGVFYAIDRTEIADFITELANANPPASAQK